MNDKDKLRRLNSLMAVHFTHPVHFFNWKKIILENAAKDNKKAYNKVQNEQVEIYTLAKELDIEDKDLKEMWIAKWCDHERRKREYSKKPQKEGRDNKDIQVGSSGSNRNKIRYPSKKRSIKTWKKFYKLFPQAAIEDGFNGKTSKRMK
jgi:ADP-heptose:LPS heptosyltransferase